MKAAKAASVVNKHGGKYAFTDQIKEDRGPDPR